MKPLSPHTAALIQPLCQPVSLWGRLTKARNLVSLLEEIGDSNESAAIVKIYFFAFSSNRTTADAAANAVHKLLRGTPNADLARIDLELRNQFSYSDELFYAWYKLQPDQLDTLDRFGKASVSMLRLCSFHSSGYVREAVVRKLSRDTTGAVVPYLLLRLNDWVANVRYAAEEAIRARLTIEYCPAFIENLGLLLRLEKTERGDHKKLIEAIYRLLQSDECKERLFQSLAAPDQFVRRLSFRLAFSSSGAELEKIVNLALDDTDSVIRHQAAVRISIAFSGATLDHYREKLRRDRFMPVRREALKIAVKLNQPNLVDELQSALLDWHLSIREDARFYLRKFKSIEPDSFYRQHLPGAEGRRLYSVISGLGETGTKADVELILPYIAHSAGKIRRATIKALAKLNRNAHINVFLEALNDAERRVSREAFKALKNPGSVLSIERIWELFSSTPHAHVKLYALSLMERFSKWESISYLINALCETDEEIFARSLRAVDGWVARFNSSFTSPSSAQLVKLRAALENCGSKIDDETRERLLFTMKGFA